MLDHVTVQVADPEASLAFYLRALSPIGIREVMRFARGDGFVVGLSGPDGFLRDLDGHNVEAVHHGF